MYAIVPTIMCSKSTQISCKQIHLIRLHTRTHRERGKRKIQLGGDTFVTHAASKHLKVKYIAELVRSSQAEHMPINIWDAELGKKRQKKGLNKDDKKRHAPGGKTRKGRTNKCEHIYIESTWRCTFPVF